MVTNSGPRWTALRRAGTAESEIDLVDQNVGARLGRQLADGPEVIFTCKRTARIVQVGDDDQASVFRHGIADPRRIEPERIRRIALEPFDAGSKEARCCEDEFVCRMLDENLVAGRDQGRHRQEVGHRRAVGGDNLLWTYVVAARDRLSQWPVPRVARTIELEVID